MLGQQQLVTYFLLLTSYFSLGCSLVIRDPVNVLSIASVGSEATVTRADALADLDFLIRTLNRVHPDPYRFHPRDVLEASRRRLVDSMPPTLTRTELCPRFNEVIATLYDGHTSMDCEQLLIAQWEAAAKMSPPQSQKVLDYPPYMRLDEQQRLIIGGDNGARGVEPGDRLLRVNGQDADALLAAWAREVSHDTDAGRLARVARRFRVYLALHGMTAPYRLTVAAPGGPPRDVTIDGEPVNYWLHGRPAPVTPPATAPVARTQTAQASRPPANTPNTAAGQPVEVRTGFFNYRVMRPGIAYMDFFSLFGDALLSTESSFKKAVDAMFRQLAIDQPRTLIVDIRENGGGDDAIAAEFLRHITGKPFRLIGSSQVRRSQEVRDAGKSLLRIPFRWLPLPLLVPEARDYYFGEIGSMSRPRENPVRTWPRAEPFFAGPVCVLTGPHTYSAAAEFAEAVKTYGLATLVGEATGGQPNSFGNAMAFRLPRSKLTFRMATSRGVRANGDVSDFRPVTPDIIVHTTQKDIQAGFDPVLERAVNCPRREVNK
jgi:hypothetical protein